MPKEPSTISEKESISTVWRTPVRTISYSASSSKLLHNFSEKTGITLEEQRTDTTLFMNNIKKAGRMSLAYDVLVKAVKAIPKEKRAEALSKALEPDFKTDVLYRTKAQEGDSRLTLLLNLCKEALSILEVEPGM
ncbi:MAG: hypothetical protein AB1447_04790, partial [Bacillota bacterium]